ncbi:methyl-accepting chemotaxis protein [Paenibacillus macquariensis]|uniref:Methyl-accepting chemotaxis protein n=1 Tax=Paenibacillus macquariensis TaxID=948756 RepID=A0ABY1K1X7_9BACL|nr:methyl-accepting chemotaxis protein [Paenibacillus macquariensis]MEC0091688.1 methyl-accepting chemotaxis protein [Paenibacillus macquariensis]OAB32385.1 chemotaxis protein [Paenibacillus macquariensis subsp. macquariensis]SIR13969.1 methyl-accepting chemotaxis protein [Paenibacillus macquariensis]
MGTDRNNKKGQEQQAKTKIKQFGSFVKGKDKSSTESNSPKELTWRKFNPAHSVGVKLFLIFFIAIVAFVLLVGVMSYKKAKSTIEDTAANANRQTIIQTSEKLDIILGQYEDIVLQLFFDTDMQSSMSQLTQQGLTEYDLFMTNKKITEKLSAQINANETIRGIVIIPPDSNMKPMTRGTIATNVDTVRSEPWFESLKDKNKSTWLPIESGNNSEETFKVVRSLKTMSGASKPFVIIIELKPELLRDQLKGIDLGSGSKLELHTNEGQIVASSADEKAGAKTKLTFKFDEKEDSGDLRTKDESGKDVLAVYSTLKTAGWKLVGTIPTSELVRSAQGILSFTIWSAIAVAVIAILIGILMVRMIARPLINLRNLLIEGSKGNLKVRSQHRSRDEIGQLSGSFNTMMEQITLLVNQTNNTAQEVLDTASELSDASNKTALSAREIAVATEEIANGASSLATEAEKGNELTDHIALQMQVVISSNVEMGKAAREVENSSELGTHKLSDLLDKTHQTEDMTRALMTKVDGLKETTMSVGKVLEVLQNITKQTNILSLNATIEAARAGAAGKGFMVIADEIRQLADQSRQSIEMVGEITERIMSEMNETVSALTEAYPLFQHQMTAVKETNDIFVSVQGQMGEYIQRLDSVTSSIEGLNQSQSTLSEAMANVSAVAEESSATSEEVASLSNEQQSIGNQLVQLSGKLENVSTELKAALSRFTV